MTFGGQGPDMEPAVYISMFYVMMNSRSGAEECDRINILIDKKEC